MEDNKNHAGVLSSDLDTNWVSTKAPGTPAAVEAMFNMMERDLTDSTAFKSGLSYLNVTRETIIEWYSYWIEGDIHPGLEERRRTMGRPMMNNLFEERN